MFATSSALLYAIDTITGEIDLDQWELLASIIGDRAPQRANAMLGARVSLL